MSFLDTLKSIIHLAPSSPATKVVTITSAENYGEIPQGFFRVETASGRQLLGYSGGFLCFNCGPTVVDGGKRVTLNVPRSELPLVKLNFRRADGAQHTLGHTLIDTDALDGDGVIGWQGKEPPCGVEWK